MSGDNKVGQSRWRVPGSTVSRLLFYKIRQGFPDEVTFEAGPKRSEGLCSTGGRASAKALRQEHSWCNLGIARRSEWLENFE